MARVSAALLDHSEGRCDPQGLHGSFRLVYSEVMAGGPHRINVTLDAQQAEKLSRLAQRTNVQEGTLARALLASAIDDADPDPRTILDLLGAIPGAAERIEAGIADADAGHTIPLDQL